MILIEIQENIIKSKSSLEYLESDFLYKLSKTISGKAEFESSLRNILNASIDLRNKVIVQVQSIIRKSENKELIALIDSGYFRKISEAMSTESLVRIVHVGAISIPETSARVVAENRDIDVVMHNITMEVNIYNASISKLKQDSNRLFLRLYSMPSASQLPKEIEGAVSLGTLLLSSDYTITSGFTSKLKDTPTETTKKEEPKKETEGKLKIKMKHKP